MSIFTKKKQYYLLCFNYIPAAANSLFGSFFAVHLNHPITKLKPGVQIRGKVMRSLTADGKPRPDVEGEDFYFWPERMYKVGLYENADQMVAERFPDLL